MVPNCLGATELYYGPEADLREEPEAERKAREQRCKEMCHGCPIEMACLEWALVMEEPFGVWGGVPHRERVNFLKWLDKKRMATPVPTGRFLRQALDVYRAEVEAKKKPPKRQIKPVVINGSRPVMVFGWEGNAQARGGNAQSASRASTRDPARTARRAASVSSAERNVRKPAG